MLRVSNIATAMGQQLVGSPTLTVSGVAVKTGYCTKKLHLVGFFLSFISKHYLVSHFRDIHCRFSLANPRKTNSIVKILLLKFHVILN